MSEFAERVARVLAERRGGMVDDLDRENARAAIKAMREPTNEMLRAFYGNTPTEDWLGEDWKDMIDAALK